MRERGGLGHNTNSPELFSPSQMCSGCAATESRTLWYLGAPLLFDAQYFGGSSRILDVAPEDRGAEGAGSNVGFVTVH